MSSAIVPVQEVEKMAQAICKSGLFGMKRPEEAMALMLIAQAEGRHPALAARDYHVIQGRPALKADAILARFQESGGKVEWLQLTDEVCEARFTHPQGSAVISWDLARAKKAELGGRDMWKKYPRQMLRARVISEGVRTVFPGVVVGVYEVEETRDMTAPPTVTVRPVDVRVESAVEEPSLDDARVRTIALIDSKGLDMKKYRDRIDAAQTVEDLRVICREVA